MATKGLVQKTRSGRTVRKPNRFVPYEDGERFEDDYRSDEHDSDYDYRKLLNNRTSLSSSITSIDTVDEVDDLIKRGGGSGADALSRHIVSMSLSSHASNSMSYENDDDSDDEVVTGGGNRIRARDPIYEIMKHRDDSDISYTPSQGPGTDTDTEDDIGYD